MNRVILIVACILAGLVYMAAPAKMNNTINSTDMAIMSDDVYDKVLRFHVLANSDSTDDQNLKIKVKSVLAKQIAADMKAAGVSSKEEAWNYIEENEPGYIELAEDTIRGEGYDYQVSATLGRHWFPVKVYGNCVYPEGEYDAFRVLIGKAEGKNWWCVLFPSLCMVDEACAGNEQEEGSMEYEEDEDNVKIKFRLVEWIQELW